MPSNSNGFRLLTVGNAKTVKGQNWGYLTGILMLAPALSAGIKNVCPWASAGCTAGCLNTAGRGVYQRTQDARIRRTREYFADRTGFLARLCLDIESLKRRAKKRGLIPAVRLDGTSDLGLAKLLAPMYPDVQFYDYTKSVERMLSFLRGDLPVNWHLTFSRSESNANDVSRVLANDGAVAVVFKCGRKSELPKWWRGYPVIDGDTHDLRFRVDRPFGHVVGLRAKGKARRDTSGFVVPMPVE